MGGDFEDGEKYASIVPYIKANAEKVNIPFVLPPDKMVLRHQDLPVYSIENINFEKK